jgi:hypothetical protein
MLKFLFITCSAVLGQKLQYVFEINRHGARAPIIKDLRFDKEPT